MMSKQGNAMKLAAMTVASLVLAASSASAQSDQAITVTRAGSQPSTAGAAENFTGSVRVDDRFKGSGEACISGATVTFEPGRAPLGTPIRLVRLLSSRKALAWCSEKVVGSRKSDLAIPSGSRRA